MSDLTDIKTSNLGEAYMDAALSSYRAFQAGSDADGLNKAISYLEESITATNDQHPEMLTRLNNLFVMLKQRHSTTGKPADIARAAEIAQVILNLTPLGDPERPSWFSELGMVKWMMYQLEGKPELLEYAISILTALTQDASPNDPSLSGRLINLSLALAARFRLYTNREDIDAAISHSNRAISLTSKTDPGYPVRLLNLGTIVVTRFEAYGDASDLDDAVATTQHAVDAASENDPHYFKYRTNLVGLLSRRYDLRGNSEDFSKAEEVAQSIIQYEATGFPASATLLAILAGLLGRRYERTGELRWLEEMLRKRREFLELTPTDSPSSLGGKNNLAIGLLEYYNRKGGEQDLDEAIRVLRGLAESVSSDVMEFPTILFNLSNSLNIKYEYSGEMRLLDESIECARALIELSSKRNQRQPGRLASLAEKLTSRFRRLRREQDIEESLKLLREELHSYPNNPRRASWLADLAVAIDWSGQTTADSDDLIDTITLLETELQTVTDQVLHVPQQLTTLANRLVFRYTKSKDLAHLSKAIQFGERAVNLIPDDGPEVGTVKNNLGYAWELRYQNSDNQDDSRQAINCYIDAWRSESSVPFHRIMAAGRGIRLLGLTNEIKKAAEIAKEVIDFLPLLRTDVVDFNDRIYIISTYSGIAANACSLLLALGKESEALEYLQKGKAIILREMQDHRELALLRKHDENLAARFDSLQHEVNAPLKEIDNPVIRSHAVDRRKEAAQELRALIKNDIRKVPGLSNFYLGHSVEELQTSAEQGYIVFVNISDLRSDAIIISSTEIRSLNLPRMKAEKLQSLLAKQWSGVRSELGIGNRAYRNFLSWLWVNGIRDIMIGVEDATDDIKESIPRIRWIGSGFAAGLPFHAAGEHEPGSTENVLSKAISSYASSTRFLSKSYESPTQTGSMLLDSVLIATMSNTPGKPDLKYVQSESSMIKDILGNRVRLDYLEEWPTTDHVKKHIQKCAIAHLACHGYVDPQNPSRSGLIFAKRGVNGVMEQDVLTLGQLADLNIQEAKIAFLSACSTAESKLVELADESLTVVSGFQIAGFRHVIGSLWASFDDVCKDVSETFYNYLFYDGDLKWSDRGIATALHKAVLVERAKHPKQPLLWAQFVHFGA